MSMYIHTWYENGMKMANTGVVVDTSLPAGKLI